MNRMSSLHFGIACAVILLAAYGATVLIEGDYLFFAGFSILQFMTLAVAWNILGGYAGYVNFGAAGFFASGAYVAVALHKGFGLPLPLLMLAGGVTGGLLGAAAGALTLRLRGTYFSIATLALAVLLETVALNWDYVGGARGAYVVPPASSPGFASYIKYLFMVVTALTLVTIAVARAIEMSGFGRALFALRDGEEAAEACGVPTLKMKVAAVSLSCFLMGMCGALLPFYLTFMEPQTAFGMNYSISAVAMAMIGGIASWAGPVIGAIVLGVTHQTTTVIFSSEIGVLALGLLLMVFVAAAPEGILGLWRKATKGGAR